MRVEQLRKWVAATAILMVVVVAGFYAYGRYRVNKVVRNTPAPLSADIAQSAEGFSISKSEGGRTLFTVKAKRALRFREGGRAELHDVNIVVYGRKADRFDQIYGAKFVYEPSSGEVRADGEVHIDLEAWQQGPQHPDQSLPAESKNPIHLKTSDLVFNQNTGLARTDKHIEFRLPQASGSAVGATYDSRQQQLTLESQVDVSIRARQPARLQAEKAVIAGEPRGAVLERVRVTQEGQSLESARARVEMREDNSIARVIATGNVRGSTTGADATEVRAQEAVFDFTPRNTLEQATLRGAVQLDSKGESGISGRAGRMVLSFSGNNQVTKIRASESVEIEQARAASGDSMKLLASAVDVSVRGGKRLDRAVTSGQAQLEITDNSATRTVVTAGKFEAEFDGQNRLRRVEGSPNANIVSQPEGQPQRVTSSRELVVEFVPGSNQVASIVQRGDFKYTEADRSASGEQARYDARSEVFQLTGSPRLTQAGATVTANTMRLNRRTGEASATGEVKTTYTNVKPQPGGAMLASGDPIHVTAASASFRQAESLAVFTGGARLWQGANIVQAPTIEFNRDRRTLVAHGPGKQPVTSVFVQQGGVPGAAKPAGPMPVRVTAGRLSYNDAERKARFEGGVTLRGADAVTVAQQVEVSLAARGQKGSDTASELQSIVAVGDIVIEQGKRRAEGRRLVYTGSDGKFVLTGGQGKFPSIFDAERGKITGDSLTFFSRDDRVLIGGENSRTVTQTRVKDSSSR